MNKLRPNFLLDKKYKDFIISSRITESKQILLGFIYDKTLQHSTVIKNMNI